MNSLNTILLLVVLLSSFFGSYGFTQGDKFSASAPNTCVNFLEPTPYGSVYSWFPHNTQYDVEISKIRIKNQCALSHCHLYSWISELEHTSGIELSVAYLDAMNIYQKAIETLRQGEFKLNLGSNSIDSRDSISSYGLIPENVWTAKKDYSSVNSYSKLFAGLESILLNATLQSTNFEDTEQIIFNFIQQMIGAWPSTFMYNGQEFTPTQFANHYFKNLNSKLVDVYVSLDGIEGATDLESQTFSKVMLRLNRENFEDTLMKTLDHGQPVYLSYNHHKQYVDSETGIMSVSAFNYPSVANIEDREVLSIYHKWTGPHAVLIVGYQKDHHTGRPIKWKIQNSWGEAAGDSGYFHMYADYFKLHAWGYTYMENK